MKSWIGAALALVVAGSVMAQEPAPAAVAPPARDPAALEVLKKADTATKAVTAVHYSATATPTGVAVNFAAAAEGESWMEGWAGRFPAKFLARLKTKKPGSDETVEFTAGGNGEQYFLLDHAAKKAYVDMDPNVFGTAGRAIFGFTMVEFVHDAPFDDELNAETVELLEDKEVAGEPCYQVRVVYGGGQGESVWLFAKKDHLPRGRVQRFTIPGQGDGAMERTLSALQIDPKMDPALFVFKLPAGYQQINDFAP